MTAKVLVGDCREVLATLESNSIDACVTDPPYGLEFMGKEWDCLREKRDKSQDLTGKSSSPFLAAHVTYRAGKTAQDWHETWAREVYRVLKPGAHLLAFSGTRTSHRMVCAIEDAGFEIRDCLMWIYGSGFPKSLDVSKAIDKAAGVEREVVGESPWKSNNGKNQVFGKFNAESVNLPVTAPATDLAKAYAGYGTALKPAYEPIVLARKPLIGSVAANVTAYGTGGINVDGCRIEYANDDDKRHNTEGLRRYDSTSGESGAFMASASILPNVERTSLGRWPANLILDEEAASLLDAMSGERGGGQFSPAKERRRSAGFSNWKDDHNNGSSNAPDNYGDTGGASRFFYTAKASRAERNKGLAGMPEVAAGGMAGRNDGSFDGHITYSQNHHPTVKPVDLMQWLVRLVTPKGGTVLDPFLGSGTTGIAADREGFDFIGIEQDAEYAEIARKRIVGDCPLFTTLAAD